MPHMPVLHSGASSYPCCLHVPNPANLVNGVRPAPVHICMICGTQPWHRPCPETAAQLAAFALTPLGQRSEIWRHSKVRRTPHLRPAPSPRGRQRNKLCVASSGIDKNNAYLAAPDNPPVAPIHDVSLPDPAVVLLDGALRARSSSNSTLNVTFSMPSGSPRPHASTCMHHKAYNYPPVRCCTLTRTSTA